MSDVEGFVAKADAQPWNVEAGLVVSFGGGGAGGGASEQGRTLAVRSVFLRAETTSQAQEAKVLEAARLTLQRQTYARTRTATCERRHSEGRIRGAVFSLPRAASRFRPPVWCTRRLLIARPASRDPLHRSKKQQHKNTTRLDSDGPSLSTRRGRVHQSFATYPAPVNETVHDGETTTSSHPQVIRACLHA